ncbi:MAG TPA: 5'/3'-nucleotidase SurE [Pseudomonadales bacterium]|nr:5'/3'-nucleotidase SurE [Pseudomonadales bacterium]
MRILVTNDDGIDSPGIHELARTIESAGHEVVVVAPDHDASGTATALGRISSELPVKVSQERIAGFKGEAYAIAGPPALCVIATHLEAFGPIPDMVISGINAGLNTGRSTLHSGTVGAVLTAQNFGLRGIAVSLDSSDDWQWQAAAALTLQVLPSVMNGPPRGAVNLNVPALPLEQIKGIRWAGLAAFNSVRSSVSAVEDGFIHFELINTDYEPEETTDLATVRAGFAALTALHGNVEVWGPASLAGDLFEAGHEIHGASVGHTLRPANSVLIPDQGLHSRR